MMHQLVEKYENIQEFSRKTIDLRKCPCLNCRVLYTPNWFDAGNYRAHPRTYQLASESTQHI